MFSTQTSVKTRSPWKHCTLLLFVQTVSTKLTVTAFLDFCLCLSLSDSSSVSAPGSTDLEDLLLFTLILHDAAVALVLNDLRLDSLSQRLSCCHRQYTDQSETSSLSWLVTPVLFGGQVFLAGMSEGLIPVSLHSFPVNQTEEGGTCHPHGVTLFIHSFFVEFFLFCCCNNLQV